MDGNSFMPLFCSLSCLLVYQCKIQRKTVQSADDADHLHICFFARVSVRSHDCGIASVTANKRRVLFWMNCPQCELGE